MLISLSFSNANAAVPKPPMPETAATSSAAGKVTLDLADFDRLRKGDERPSLTVIDLMRLQGSFRAKDLAIQFSGRATGKLPTAVLLTGSQGVRLYACEGDAIVSRSDGGRFDVSPLASRFSARCRVATSGSDRVQMTASTAVLWVESAVTDGEFVATDESSGERSFSVVRQTGTATETVKPSATARYRLSLHPEETRFRYQLDVRNPNRAHQPFDVTLASGETVQQVDARATYDVDKGRYRFDLPPGESSIVIQGTLVKPSFAPPVAASISYALIESHPLLRPEITGASKRVAQSEVGLSSQFRGAQAFLLAPGESLAWKITRLQALRTTSFAVSAIRHIFFLTTGGTALGETLLSIDNQGAPDITLPMKSEPTYASIQSAPVLLTKNKDGNLWLPISQGRQDLLTQHRQKFGINAVFASGTVFLPQVTVPATSGSVEMRYPRGWTPLYEEFDNETKVWVPSMAASLLFILLLIWTERDLAALGFALRRRVFISLVVGLAATSTLGLEAIVAANALVSIVWLVGWIRGLKTLNLRIATVAGLVVAALVVGNVGVFGFGDGCKSRDAKYMAPSTSSGNVWQKSAGKLTGERTKTEIAAGDVTTTTAADGASYQGLPAKIDLPHGNRQTHFQREMMASDPPRAVRVLLVSSGALVILSAVLGFLAAVVLVLFRRTIAAGGRALFARAKGHTTPASAEM